MPIIDFGHHILLQNNITMATIYSISLSLKINIYCLFLEKWGGEIFRLSVALQASDLMIEKQFSTYLVKIQNLNCLLTGIFYEIFCTCAVYI